VSPPSLSFPWSAFFSPWWVDLLFIPPPRRNFGPNHFTICPTCPPRSFFHAPTSVTVQNRLSLNPPFSALAYEVLPTILVSQLPAEMVKSRSAPSPCLALCPSARSAPSIRSPSAPVSARRHRPPLPVLFPHVSAPLIGTIAPGPGSALWVWLPTLVAFVRHPPPWAPLPFPTASACVPIYFPVFQSCCFLDTHVPRRPRYPPFSANVPFSP